MSMMVGIGPFITIPSSSAHMGGPQAMLGWVLGGLVAPGRRPGLERAGRGLPGLGRARTTSSTPSTAESGPAGCSSSSSSGSSSSAARWSWPAGRIGLATTLGYFWPALDGPAWSWPLVPGLAWAVTWGQVGAIGVLATRHGPGLPADRGGGAADGRALGRDAGHGRLDDRDRPDPFRPALGLRLPGRPGGSTAGSFVGLGMALGSRCTTILGYYQVCYLGDEVADPPRTIPRSILISTVAVAVIYLR